MNQVPTHFLLQLFSSELQKSFELNFQFHAAFSVRISQNLANFQIKHLEIKSRTRLMHYFEISNSLTQRHLVKIRANRNFNYQSDNREYESICAALIGPRCSTCDSMHA